MLTVDSVAFSARSQDDGTLSFEVSFYIHGKLFTVRESYSPRPLPWHTVYYGREQYGIPCDVRVRFPWAAEWSSAPVRDLKVTAC
jgi:hypothetical protein